MARIYRSFTTTTSSGIELRVVVHSRARNISLRQGIEYLRLTVPPGIEVAETQKAIETLLPRLAEKSAKRPQLTRHYAEGQVIDLPNHGTSITITRTADRPRTIRYINVARRPAIAVDVNLDIASASVTRHITQILLNIGRLMVQTAIIPRAMTLAAKIRRQPAGWKCGHGMRTLGTCSSRRVITLSAALAYYPTELVDYVIYHELAHLDEMNHSDRFHALLDTYLDGREADLTARLRRYRAPLIK